MLMFSSKHRNFGFSLVELMIAVALLGLLSAYAVPSYRAWIQNNQIRNAAESIQSGLQVARGEAVSRNASVQFDLRGTNSAWTVCAIPVAPGACPAVDDATTVQSRGVREGSSTNVTVTTSDAGPFVFNGLGVMISPAPAAASGLVSINVDNSILTAAESRDLRVVIGVGGSSRMCDPTLPSAGTDPRKCP